MQEPPHFNAMIYFTIDLSIDSTAGITFTPSYI
jgi:hypothetical protein